MKLFPKLALGITALLLVSTLGLSLSFYWIEERSLRTQAGAARAAVLQNLVHMTQESFLANDDLLLIKYAGWLRKWNPSVVSASVVAPDGDVIAHSEPGHLGKAAPIAEADPRHVLVLSAPVPLGGGRSATASVSFSEQAIAEALDHQLALLKRRVIWVGGSALGLGLVMAFLIALSWTRPIRVLTAAAEEVGQGKYQIDLKGLPRRRDELGAFSRIFQSMAEQLRQLDQMKEDFVSAVTHELRSPLGAIESYLNVIEEEWRDDASNPVWKTYLERMRLNTQRLTRFVNDLLDVAALERGKITLDRRPVPIGPIIQDVLNLFTPKMAERRLVVRTDIAADLPPAFADAEKVRQVLTNLLSNAIKFTPAEGLIEAGVRKKTAETLEVFVKDSGIGIPRDEHQRIFNKFEQVPGARQAVKGPKGTGLGLSICRALVELHGGMIGVTSAPKEGSRFFFTLPLAGAAQAALTTSVQGELV